MKRETLFTVYRSSLQNPKTGRMNIDDLSAEEFVATYAEDPFFQQRVNVELEKIQAKLENSSPSCAQSLDDK